MIECSSYYVILECDENGHKQYDPQCEIVRMNNISSALDLPVKYIRYNPDSKDLNKKEREARLIKTVQSNINKDFMENLDVIYI